MNTENGSVRILAGYPMDSLGRPIRQIDSFDPTKAHEYRGNFFFLSISHEGTITTRKSVICSYQLYLSRYGTTSVLASRASLAFAAAHSTTKASPDAAFARWTCSFGIGGNSATIFADTCIVLMNQQVVFEKNRITLTNPDYCFLEDVRLRELFLSNRQHYWDEAYERLLAATSVLEYADSEIHFPLSGGKDSRLLLAMALRSRWRDRITKVYTNGPSFSPEVKAASLVCSALGVKHEAIDKSTAEVPQAIAIDNKLGLHALLTEGEVTPFDLSWGRTASPMTQLNGQEGGLRNIAGRNDLLGRQAVLSWFSTHLANGDQCGIFLPGVGSASIAETQAFVDQALEAGVRPDDIPTLHAIIFRLGRRVARIWRIDNDRCFSPYLFVDTDIIKYTYNSGGTSRAAEEFHFEMLRRIEPRLIEIPFSGQAWQSVTLASSGFSPAAPFLWPDEVLERRSKATRDALVQNFSSFQKFFRTHSGSASDTIIDRLRFDQLDLERLHQNRIPALWQLVQTSLFELVGDLSALQKGPSSVDFGLPSFDIG